MPVARPALAAIALMIALAGGDPALARHHPHVAAAAGPLRSGDYVCEGNGAGMFPLAILPASRYRAAGPAGRYVLAGRTLRFVGGSLANNIGTLDGLGSFALATVDSRQPYTHCTRAPGKPGPEPKR